ncbi:Ogr/Delta-like zinc finger [compost metagenome]
MSMHIRELEKYNIMPGSVLGLHFPRSKSKAYIHKKTASDNGERMTCIDCHADAVIRTSWQMSPLMRETTYHCTNECCKGVFVAYVEIVCTISPSGIPRVNVQLPLSGHINRESLGIVLGSADAYQYTPRRTYPPANGDLFAGDRPAGTSS